MNVYQFNQKKYDDFFVNDNVPDFVKLRAKENKDNGEYQFSYEIMYYNYLHELNGLSPTSDESLSSCNGCPYKKYMIRVSN